jgi:hypothetical protein
LTKKKEIKKPVSNGGHCQGQKGKAFLPAENLLWQQAREIELPWRWRRTKAGEVHKKKKKKVIGTTQAG